MEYNKLPPLTSHLSPGLASQGLLRRMRRNRATPAIRALVQETKLHREDLIQPLFFHGGTGGLEVIDSMPGVMRHTLLSLVEECRLLVDLGIPAVAIFPCIDPSHKEPKGEHALNPGNVLYAAIRAIKAACPHLAVIADVALDPYTSHGHDGLLNSNGCVENDSTVELLARLAVAEAEAGADVVAPSDMMDGRVMAIRLALDEKKFHHVGIMAYSAKYASAYYGPFREAVGSKSSKAPLDFVQNSTSAANCCVTPVLESSGMPYTFRALRSEAPCTSSAQASLERSLLDKSDYQMNPANLREALLEAQIDEEEGADILMIKPAGAYLDVIRAVRESTLLPVAAYQVSGEYAQICAAARLGWLDYRATRDEALLAIKRAGATMILTYFAAEVARESL